MCAFSSHSQTNVSHSYHESVVVVAVSRFHISHRSESSLYYYCCLHCGCHCFIPLCVCAWHLHKRIIIFLLLLIGRSKSENRWQIYLRAIRSVLMSEPNNHKDDFNQASRCEISREPWPKDTELKWQSNNNNNNKNNTDERFAFHIRAHSSSFCVLVNGH